ncbi:putative adenylyl cyclase CyaB [Oesophagostomum dentatum]|uniref:Putative adenylyl cyclase CyaB n=1 Tax=Oesophagostomum dentatum TaxID=61180 RepID=A0A0B1TAW7_OESDE|nr:putative adenylyl cyclase CyaB [Oesophagostomum dentatum]
MARNVEIKAKVRNREEILKLAKGLTGTEPTLLIQHDIFYNSPQGRLKMRSVEEQGEERTELIWYDRPDQVGPKLCNFTKFEVPAGIRDPLKEVLRSSMGVKGEVKKVRNLFLLDRTRIHIDNVEGLGDFMELEVCLRGSEQATDGEHIADEIRQKLGVLSEDLLEGAYMDMLNEA